MGHLYRAMTLCETLHERGFPFRVFINRNEVTQAILEQRGISFDLTELDPGGSGWQSHAISRYGISLWIDDRLNTDARHSRLVKDSGIPLVTFDDRGDGAAMADLNIVALSFDDTESLPGRKVLRGPRYLILNREITRYRHSRTGIGSIVVTLGGSDTYGVTVKVVRILKSAGLGATVIVGPAFKHMSELNQVLDDHFVLKRNVPSLMKEFSRHALAITGGGITPFEANSAGLPCIIIANEDFEIPVGEGLTSLGGAIFAGHHSRIDAHKLTTPLPVETMSKAAMRAVDLQGVDRVLDEIEGLM
jgi:spore coat polysaccharide biosynthesis predicted glycosyltransferase SpsG